MDRSKIDLLFNHLIVFGVLALTTQPLNYQNRVSSFLCKKRQFWIHVVTIYSWQTFNFTFLDTRCYKTNYFFFCSYFCCLQCMQMLRQNKFRILSIDGTMASKNTFPEVLNSTHQIPKGDRYKYLTSGVFDSRFLSSYEQFL